MKKMWLLLIPAGLYLAYKVGKECYTKYCTLEIPEELGEPITEETAEEEPEPVETPEKTILYTSDIAKRIKTLKTEQVRYRLQKLQDEDYVHKTEDGKYFIYEEDLSKFKKTLKK